MYSYVAGNYGGAEWLPSTVSMKFKFKRSLFKFGCCSEAGSSCGGPKGFVVGEDLDPRVGGC